MRVGGNFATAKLLMYGLGLSICILFFQNCRPTNLEATQLISYENPASSIQGSSLLSSSQAPPLSLASDGYLVADGQTVELTQNGEAILVWKALGKAHRCTLAGVPVDPVGGPRSFQNLEPDRVYSFECDSEFARSSLSFKTVSASAITARSNSVFPVDVFIVAGHSNAVGQDIPLNALASAGYQPTLKGVLWVQGENDALAINQGLMGIGPLIPGAARLSMSVFPEFLCSEAWELSG